MRGEKSKDQFGIVRVWGSPPRARGKAAARAEDVCSVGITPACAGKSRDLPQRRRPRRDHPRVRGEKATLSEMISMQAGSPPRARGKDIRTGQKAGKEGITPARAGKSSRMAAMSARTRDHPRACGEKSERQSSKTAHQGSPPRVRGKVAMWLSLRMSEGITPARAGKSGLVPCVSITSKDHPRACGEKSGSSLLK